MAFQHPQSRKDNRRKEEKSGGGGVVEEFFERTVDVARYRNAEHDVNPADNRTFGGVTQCLSFFTTRIYCLHF